MLKKLKKYLESENKDKTIFDIVIYGSFVKGKEKAGDIDILIIFLEGALRERLDKIQTIKNKIKDKIEAIIDIKQILLKDLFSSDFLAKTGIFLEGDSVFKDKKFSETFGFKPYILFYYDLKGLTHTQKVKFNYILAGRNTKGMIKELSGERLVNGTIKIPIENSLIFEDILNNNKVNYHKIGILEAQ
ncbi:MAG: nucleotidyltransferase domain-containing protein [Nanoarchaeota archaeon]